MRAKAIRLTSASATNSQSRNWYGLGVSRAKGSDSVKTARDQGAAASMARPWVRMALAVAAMNRRAPGCSTRDSFIWQRGLVYTGSGALRAGDPRGRWNAFRAIADSARMDAMPADPRDPPAFSLSQFEWLVHRRQHEAAGRLLLLGLRRLDERHGALPAGLSEDARAHFPGPLGGGHRRPVRRPGLPGLARRLRAVPDAAALAGGHLRRHAVRACGSRDRRAGRRDARAGRRTGVEPGRLAQVLRVVRAGFRTGRAAGRALGA